VNMPGDFTVINSHLIRALEDRGLWDEVMMDYPRPNGSCSNAISDSSRTPSCCLTTDQDRQPIPVSAGFRAEVRQMLATACDLEIG
jgi:hypothetical protein